MQSPTPYIVRRGDYLFGLACRFGFNADDVWNDDKNAELNRLRKGEMNLLHPGDLLYIPKPPEGSVDLQAESELQVIAATNTVTLRAQFVLSGKPLAGLAFERDACCTEDSDTETDGDGHATLVVPTYVKEVLVRFPEQNLEYRLQVGDLNPVDTLSGQIQRLEALGCYAPLPLLESDLGDEASMTLALARAIAAFQERQGLTITSEMDDATAAELVKAFGS